jgi:hypothetical protein
MTICYFVPWIIQGDHADLTDSVKSAVLSDTATNDQVEIVRNHGSFGLAATYGGNHNTRAKYGSHGLPISDAVVCRASPIDDASYTEITMMEANAYLGGE